MKSYLCSVTNLSLNGETCVFQPLMLSVEGYLDYPRNYESDCLPSLPYNKWIPFGPALVGYIDEYYFITEDSNRSVYEQMLGIDFTTFYECVCLKDSSNVKDETTKEFLESLSFTFVKKEVYDKMISEPIEEEFKLKSLDFIKDNATSDFFDYNNMLWSSEETVMLYCMPTYFKQLYGYMLNKVKSIEWLYDNVTFAEYHRLLGINIRDYLIDKTNGNAYYWNKLFNL